MTFSTRGLIIREQYTGESDRIVTVLTEDRGIVRAFAKGARKTKSTTLSSTQLLCFSSLSFSERKDTYNVTEAKPIEIFFPLRSDIKKLALAQYFCEVAGQFTTDSEEAHELLRLILNCLKFLCDGNRNDDLIKSIFELRLICLAGYMPDLSGCANCGRNSDTMFFSAISGQLFCENCPSDGIKRISNGVLAACRHICYSHFEKIFNFTLEEKSIKELAELSERFLLLQSDRKFKTLDFYKSLG